MDNIYKTRSLRQFLRMTVSVLIGMLTISIVTSCHDQKKLRIGVSQCSDDDWRQKLNNEIKREMLLHDNVEVEIRSADDDPLKQKEDIEYFAENGFDIIIASPVEAVSMTPVIDKVFKEGKPVILFDREILSDSYTAKITADNKGIGEAAGKYALQMKTKPRHAIEVRGLKGSTPADGRHEGFVRSFTEGGGVIVADGYGDWNQTDAYRLVSDLLKKHPETDLIYAHNDRMALGAREAVRESGRNNISIIGIDAAPEIGIKAVSDSLLDATFLYPTEGHRIISTAIDILNGKKVERNVEIPVTSAVDITNADILLMQDRMLVEETEKISELKGRIDQYWEKYSNQTTLFYLLLFISLLIILFLFVLLKAYWTRKRTLAQLEDQNRKLEKQRDIEKSLNQQLKEANESKLMFFTNVSHDLRTPLTLISEPIEQLNGADNLTPRQSALVKIADKNVHILKRLINQILDFRKYENGKLDLNPEEVDLASLCKDWTDSFKTLALKRDIKLKEDFPAAALNIAIDPEKIERVFFNLLSNAFKYTPDNGTIRVSLNQTDNKVILKVSDTGEGIPKENLSQIFDRFFQVKRVKPKGSGIGLSLSKAFVELHGGEISVESTPGSGSEFTVILPLRHIEGGAKSVYESTLTSGEVESELQTIGSSISEADISKPVLLIIDDNPDIRKLIAELMGDDYRIISAPNGKEGVRLATKYIPDLIICDIMMPVMDGLECVHILKEEISTSHIPILLLTACSTDEQRAEGFMSGADGYLSKPFSSKVLKAQSESIIRNRKVIRNLWKGDGLIPSTDQASASPTIPEPVASPNGSLDSEFYSKFLSIFEKEMGNADLSVEQLASQMNLGHSQFYRKIKALTNYTPVELIRRLRLEKARSLLTTTEKAISEIAYEVGFSTPAYFTKCYRTAYGETPTELRERLGR